VTPQPVGLTEDAALSSILYVGRIYLDVVQMTLTLIFVRGPSVEHAAEFVHVRFQQFNESLIYQSLGG
jgi:hypothetical protein